MKYLPLLIALTGCAPTTAPESAAPAGQCDAAPVQDLVGKPYDAALGSDAQTRSGSRGVRVIRPGQAVTMDYRADRLNIELNAGERVVSLRCG